MKIGDEVELLQDIRIYGGIDDSIKLKKGTVGIIKQTGQICPENCLLEFDKNYTIWLDASYHFKKVKTNNHPHTNIFK